MFTIGHEEWIRLSVFKSKVFPPAARPIHDVIIIRLQTDRTDMISGADMLDKSIPEILPHSV